MYRPLTVPRMDLVWHLFITIAAATAFQVTIEQSSPCPNVFQYKTRGDFYQYGLLTVPSPPLGQPSVVLLASFIQRGRLPTQYGGLIELQRTQNETIDDIQHKQPINFVIHFPVQTPLPRIKFVVFNKQLICGVRDQHDVFHVHRQMINKIDFRYTFNTSDIEKIDAAHNESFVPSVNAIEPNLMPVRESFDYQRKWPTAETNLNVSTPFVCGVLHDTFTSSPSMVTSGTHIERGSWPWLVAIYALKPTGPLFVCAGTLVSPKSILTAASCIRSTNRHLNSFELLVIAGRHNMSDWLESDTQSMYVSSLHVHTHFVAGSASDDIALIILTDNLQLNKFVLPACLGTNTDEPSDPDPVPGTVVGWNEANDYGVQISPTPVSLIAPMVPDQMCRCTRDMTKDGPTSRSFCAGSRHDAAAITVCNFNLGSGFVALQAQKLTVRGIVANRCDGGGSSCGNTGYMVVTDVSMYMEWYNALIKAHSQ